MPFAPRVPGQRVYDSILRGVCNTPLHSTGRRGRPFAPHILAKKNPHPPPAGMAGVV